MLPWCPIFRGSDHLLFKEPPIPNTLRECCKLLYGFRNNLSGRPRSCVPLSKKCNPRALHFPHPQSEDINSSPQGHF